MQPANSTFEAAAAKPWNGARDSSLYVGHALNLPALSFLVWLDCGISTMTIAQTLLTSLDSW